MLFCEVLQVFVAELLGPTINRIAFGLRTCVLRRVSQVLAADDRRPLGAVKGDEVSLVIHQIAAQVNSKIRVLIKRLNQIGVIATVFKVKEPSGGLPSFSYGVYSGNETNPRNQVHEQISCQALAVVGE